MDRLEYLTVNVTRIKWEDKEFTSRSKELDNLGNEGWELVCAINQYLYFKRRKKA